MSEPFIGEIRIFGGNFAPKNWALCNGQILPIASNTALFAILGTMYGGDGKTTFALPNLQGSAPLAAGQGPGLTLRELGESGGERTVTLNTGQVPPHTHPVMGNDTAGNQQSPAGNVTAMPHQLRPLKLMYSASTGTAPKMNAQILPNVGGGQPHNNMSPYLGLSFIIALKGLFPPRG